MKRKWLGTEGYYRDSKSSSEPMGCSDKIIESTRYHVPLHRVEGTDHTHKERDQWLTEHWLLSMQ